MLKVRIQNTVQLKSPQTLIYFVTQKEQNKNRKKRETSFFSNLGKLGENLKSHFKQALKNKSITGKKKECVLFRSETSLFQKDLLYVGLGKENELTLEKYREVAGETINFLKSSKIFNPIHVILNKNNLQSHFESSKSSTSSKPSFEDILQALTQGFKLASYSFDDHKKNSLKSEFKKNKERKKINEVSFIYDRAEIHNQKKSTLSQSKKQASSLSSSEKSVKASLEKAEILSDCVNFVRWLSDKPGNLMTPSILALETQKASKSIKGLKVLIWDKARIKKERMGGLYGVSLGSSADPRFIIMEYRGAPSSHKPLCFVGKGLTFDSGGISIKPSNNMHEMKYDMCGGAAVIGTLLAISRLKLKVNVLGLVPSSENMPGPLANKPGDILIARNGKSVEVLNTDAEGRLILMDALSYASEKNPKAIFDAATLTGAVVVALGNIYTGVFTRKKDLWEKIERASQKTGERLWRLPLHDFHGEDMKGKHADLSNISKGYGAGSSTAAAFLESFVKKDTPWAHFDIAGTSYSVGNRLSYCPQFGASGALMRTFVALAESY